MARPHPVHALLDWLGDDYASRGRNPDMVNEWTSNDLPVAFEDSKRPGQYWNPSPELMADLAVWLNEHQPKPDGGASVRMGTAANNMLRETLANVERDRDRWRRAHEIVEGERDLARDRCRELERERDEARSKWVGQESDL